MLLTYFLIHQHDKHPIVDVFMMLKACKIILLLNNYTLLQRLLFLKEGLHFSSANAPNMILNACLFSLITNTFSYCLTDFTDPCLLAEMKASSSAMAIVRSQ